MQSIVIILIVLSISIQIQCDDIPLRLPQILPCKYIGNANVTKRIDIECESQNLATLSVFLKKLSEYTINRLELNKQEFSLLYGSLFHNTILEELHIHDTPIENIEENTLVSLQETLKDLSIVNSHLQSFPTQALQTLSNIKILKLDGNYIKKIDKASFLNSSWTNNVEIFFLTNGAIDDIEAGSFMYFKKLKKLYLNNNQLSLLKRNQFQGLREVEYLDLSYNQLTKVDTSHIGDLSKLVYFNASHNQLTEIARGAFARNSVLRLLNLSNNKIKRLDQHSFRGMRFLSRLYLSDNVITDVSRGTFESVKRISTINLARNLITKIDYGMFFELNYVESIDIAENQIVSIQKQAFKDLYLTHINISHNSVTTIERGAFENCVNMTLLDLSHNNISDFYPDAFDINSYPGEFNLQFNFLTNFSRIPLGHMLGIRAINVSFNNITTMPKQTTLKLFELNTIDASHNNISEIADNIFQPAIALRFLNLSYNALEKLKISTFGAISTLLELDLSHNKLNKVPKETFVKLVSLRYLNMEHNLLDKMIQPPLALSVLNFKNNQLSSIDAQVWPVMNALLTLDLTNNALNDNLVDENFASLLTLRELFLTNNNITKISKGSFRRLNSLQYLGLNNNQITQVEKDAFGKMSIFVLNLHENMISEISDLAFSQLTHLSTLILSKNMIKFLPSDAFKGLLSVRIIDLSDNKIERTDNKTNSVFEYCLNIEEIHLRNNKISFLSKKSLPYDQWFAYKLRYLDLSYNVMPILTNDITVGSQNLVHLNLSHNLLQDLRTGVLSKMASLQLLDISHNNLKEFNQSFTSNFSTLLMTNNKIHTLSWNFLSDLPNLNKIDIRNNNITKLNESLIHKLEAGMEMMVQGNHLDCDCHLRPFFTISYANKSIKLDLNETICNSIDDTKILKIGSIREEMLVCPDEDKNDSNIILSGLQFRVVRFTKGFLWLSWLIKGGGDVADFYINIKDKDDKNTINEFHIPYDKRTFNISLNNIKSNNMELCLLSKDSKGKINKWFHHQCFTLDEDWKKINKKCFRSTARYCDIINYQTNALRSPKIISAYSKSINLKTELTFVLFLIILLKLC